MSEHTGINGQDEFDFGITFKDQGNCDIYHACPSARSFLEALSKAWDSFREAGHLHEEVWSVEIAVLPF